MSKMTTEPIGQLFDIEKGSLQSTKCTPGDHDFITAAEEWKTHNDFTHKCEALIFAAAASGSLGRTHYVNGKFITSDLCYILTPKNKQTYPINIKFYHFVFNYFKEDIVRSTKAGTSKESINQTNFKKHRIPYFGIEQQNRWITILINIRNKRKLLFEEIDLQQSLLNKLRQSILQDAIQGKLTEEWRKNNLDIEPASELLKHIKAEKEKLIKEKKIKKQKPLPPIKDENIPFKIPINWAWCRFGDVFEVNPRNKSNDTTKAAFIPMPLVSEKFGYHPKFEIRKWGEIKKGYTHFMNNDVVVAKITPCFENSKAGIMKGLPNKIGAGTTELHVLRRYNNELDLGYIYLNIKSDIFLLNGITKMTGTVGQKRVPRSYLEQYMFPVPPLKEQKVIANKIASLFMDCDHLESHIEKLKENSELLIQAVLREAFTE